MEVTCCHSLALDRRPGQIVMSAHVLHVCTSITHWNMQTEMQLDLHSFLTMATVRDREQSYYIYNIFSDWYALKHLRSESTASFGKHHFLICKQSLNEILAFANYINIIPHFHVDQQRNTFFLNENRFRCLHFAWYWAEIL